ncbi:DMT family transporter [Mangrovibrevibacter kandeliae]|uniref:DMT family transporter n=1 Tax=Mangrovibrevibacter kandeliae TaxID=2968473 RepID=UPI002117AC0F|nr:DMT family transporter [Aurantimonas sp. CSK15Z-1]MCQ8780618.1 DMT family transporter [Aurantimonas sp. CSK15Z-1]
MQVGILLAFMAYLSFSCGDASVKALGDTLPVFEIGFFVSLFALVPTLLTKRPEDDWASILRPTRPWLVLVRAVSGTTGGILSVIAFTTLPLAEAYALIFLLPVLVTIFSRLVLKETIGWKRWSAVLLGLCGVLLVVRPGFREILPGHFAAFGCAVCGAVTVIVLRVLGPSERRITLIGAVLVSAVAVNGVLMATTYVHPGRGDFAVLLLGGLAAGLGHLCIVFATRTAPAARVAPTQYSQIIWAALLGAAFFGEYPDAISVAGMAMVGCSGLFTFVREEKRVGWSRKTPLLRNRG